MLKIQCNYAHLECSKRMKIFDYAIIVLCVCVEMKEEELRGRAARVDSKLNKQFVQMENILIASINCAYKFFKWRPSRAFFYFVSFFSLIPSLFRFGALLFIHQELQWCNLHGMNEMEGKKKKNKCTHKKTFEWIFAGIVFENNRRLMRKLNAIPNFQLGMHLYEHEVCGDDLLRRALERANSKCFSLFQFVIQIHCTWLDGLKINKTTATATTKRTQRMQAALKNV